MTQQIEHLGETCPLTPERTGRVTCVASGSAVLRAGSPSALSGTEAPCPGPSILSGATEYFHFNLS